jgi:tetratricopeptide (TPR) repeat protein
VAAATRDDLEVAIDTAEATARRAIVLAPDDARVWFALGGLLLRSELDKIDPEGVPSGISPDRKRIEEARDDFTKAIDLSARRGVPGFQATALIRRATATALLDDIRGAHQDIEEARRVAPSEVAVLVAAARMEEERGNHAEGVQLLRQAIMRQEDVESRFLLGIALWNENAPGDRAEAVETLSRVGIGGGVHAEPANELAVEGLIAQGRHDDARKHLEQIESKVDGCLVATMRARTESAAGQAEEAIKYGAEAVRQISSTTSRATLRKLGRLLVSLGRLADSFSVWERLLVKGEVNDDTRSFVECAGRLGRDSKVLEVCADARRAGVFEWFLLQWELRLLDRYDPGTALDVLVEFSRREPANERARVYLVHLALRLGRRDLAEANIATLPDVVNAEAEEGAAVVAALATLGRTREAIKYAYDLLRRHFHDHHAHRAFRDAVMFRDRASTDEIDVPLEAGPGVAVCLVEDGAAAPQWFVIEDSPVQATGVDDEIRPDSGLGRKLAGKRVGDEVNLSEGPGLKRSAVVRELLPKHVFRVRDVLDRWQYRFPDNQEMWMVRVGQPGDDAKPDFSSLIELAKAQHRRQKEAEEIYANKTIPIRLFGEALGETEIYAQLHIAGTDGLFLRCCIGSPDEYADAVGSLKTAADVVLDLTALTTLWMLDELSILDVLGKNPIISHSTMEGVRAFAEKARTNVRSESSMGANENGPLLFVATPEQKEAALLAAQRFLKTVEEKCRVVGCAALAEVDPEDRKLMERGIGASALESAVLGAGASRVVWNDDGVAALLEREKFGTKRVWTQAVFRWLNEQGLVSNERYAKASARLLGFQYMFTSVNPEVLRCCSNQAEWRPERWPLKQALAYLSLDAVRPEDAALLSAILVAHCYLDSVLPETRTVLLQAVCETLAKRTDCVRVVPLFGTLLGRVFGLNLAGQRDAIWTFEAWQREYVRRLRR